jgi:hypothetical protein
LAHTHWDTRNRALGPVVVVSAVLVGGIVALAVPFTSPEPSSVNVAPGPRAVPGGILRQADIPRNAVLLESATDGGRTSPARTRQCRRVVPRCFVRGAGYAVLAYQGRNADTTVSLHPDTYTSRLLLDRDGNTPAAISWASGTKPFPAQVFGTRFDVAPE